jgi:lysophospholipase L1-like esterase
MTMLEQSPANPHGCSFRSGTQNPPPQGVPVRVRPPAPQEARDSAPIACTDVQSTAPASRSQPLSQRAGKNAIVALAALAIAACGGGGSDPAPSTPPDAAPTCKPVVTVQLFGDSTQWLAFDDGAIQAVLAARFGNRVIVTNQAVPGTTSAELVAGTDGLNPPWPGNLTADVAIVNHGINDASHHTPEADYAANLRAFAAGNGVTRVVLETPNPVASWHTQNDAYTAIGREVAADTGTPLADVQAYVLGLPDWVQLLNDDGVHPSPELQRLIAENVTGPALAPIIERILCR